MNSFSIREALRVGWQTFKVSWKLILGVLLLSTAINLAPALVGNSIGADNSGMQLIVSILSWVFGIIIGIGQLKIAIELVDKKSPPFSELFSHYRLFFHTLFTQIMVGIIVVIGLVLLIIPGIVFALRLQFAVYAVVDGGMGPLAAISASWTMTKGSTIKLLLYAIASFLVLFAGLLLLGVGLILAVPTTMLATAYIYRTLSSRVITAPQSV